MRKVEKDEIHICKRRRQKVKDRATKDKAVE